VNSVTDDPQLKSWLVDNPVPAPRTRAKGPLFHGTLVFVRVVFHEQHRPLSAISLADVQTAVSYATLAAILHDEPASIDRNIAPIEQRERRWGRRSNCRNGSRSSKDHWN
jgi:hypothetical protein